jgi:aldose 1-epimerase
MNAPTGLQHHLRHGAQEATVTQVGASLRAYRVDGLDVVLPYPEDAMAPAYSGTVLAPWPNRLQDGSYRLDGTEYQVPINEVDRRTALHGLTPHARFEATEVADDRLTLVHTLVPTSGYPWAVRVAVTYTLSDSGLEVRTLASLDEAGAAPFGIGFHPWLAPGPGGVDACTLWLDAADHVTVDARLLPTGLEPADPALRTGLPLATVQLDDAWSGAGHDEDGLSLARLLRSDGRTAVLWGDRAVTAWQVCTGDAVPPIRRAGVAVEPMSCVANAFRTGTDLVMLSAGRPHELRWGLRLE